MNIYLPKVTFKLRDSCKLHAIQIIYILNKGMWKLTLKYVAGVLGFKPPVYSNVT